MREEDLNDAAAGAVLGIETSMVTKLRNRTRNASMMLSLQIERRSHGKVRAEELPISKKTRAALKALRPTENAA